MAIVLAALALAQAVVSAGNLPASLARGSLEACAPKTLAAAEECLKKALSPSDLATLQQRLPARRFRPALDKELTRAWQLADTNSPMGRTMDALLGQHMPDVAAGMIIGDLQARAAGQPIDFQQIARMFKEDPPPDAPDGTPITMTVPNQEKTDGN